MQQKDYVCVCIRKTQQRERESDEDCILRKVEYFQLESNLQGVG